MSSLVLARKYRPRNFAEMVGQAHVVQALGNALTRGRLHHAYLFTGTRGIGKTTVARILAKSLDCTGVDGQGGITAEPCGVCQACREIDAGRYIDYVELDAASNRGVDEISQLLDQAVYKPVLGRFKVYMIDEVHMLSTTAFNAMLKTLEEPPDYLKFVLATTDPQKVPATVLSRCLQFNLRPMALPTLQSHLATVLAAERIDADPGALRLIARAARGSMRDALSLADQAIAFGAGALRDDEVRAMLGAVERGHAVRIVEAVAAADGAALIAAVDGLRGLGLSASGALEELAALLQQMAVLKALPQAADPDDPEAPETARLAGLLDADEIQLLYSIALHARGELGLAPDEYGGLVMALLRMLAFRPKDAAAAPAQGGSTPNPAAAVAGPAPRATPVPTTPVAVIAVEAAAPNAAVAAPTPMPVAAKAPDEPPPWDEPPAWLDEAPPADDAIDTAAVPAETAATARAGANRETAPASTLPSASATSESSPFVPSPLGARWAALVNDMIAGARLSAFARELAMQAECLALDDAAAPVVCRLRVERENLRAAGPRDKLQAALAEVFERPVQLVVESGRADDSPTRRDGAERARRQTEAERIIRDDPLVRSLMDQYKTARIVPGSIRPH